MNCYIYHYCKRTGRPCIVGETGECPKLGEYREINPACEHFRFRDERGEEDDGE